MSENFYRFGLVGYPLDHSLSPQLHQAALEALGLAGEYRLYPISPCEEDESALRDLLRQMRNGVIHGLNVTIPYKQRIISLLDVLTPDARAIGAVNTIYQRDGILTGENTDAAGFLADVGRYADKCGKALVLGAGGAARAVVYALASAWKRVYVAARRLEQAQELADDLRLHITGAECSITPLSLDTQSVRQIKDECDLIVNATPLGMVPDIESNPWPEGEPLPKNAVIYDLVYNPSITALVRSGRAGGGVAVSGLGMLIEQAGLAFECWTGKKPPGKSMFQALPSGQVSERIVYANTLFDIR
ncbi:MAG: shikimate dehydrogenase [Anaerolineaceae bacterium]|nr:shikimate dehydrogenase [Anaerolineaceae bacterium]